MGTAEEQSLKEFMGVAIYDPDGQMIFGKTPEGDQLLANVEISVRGWGKIQYLFKDHKDAMKFQDNMGKFIADAINEKLNSADQNAELKLALATREIRINELRKEVEELNRLWAKEEDKIAELIKEKAKLEFDVNAGNTRIQELHNENAELRKEKDNLVNAYLDQRGLNQTLAKQISELRKEVEEFRKSEEDRFQKVFGRKFHHPVGTRMGYVKIGDIDWEEISKKKPPEDNRQNKAWAGAWLEGEMVGFARCMVKYGLHRDETGRREYEQLRQSKIDRLQKEIEELKAGNIFLEKEVEKRTAQFLERGNELTRLRSFLERCKPYLNGMDTEANAWFINDKPLHELLTEIETLTKKP